jgi:3-deoxy-D-manno-octulosonate 8-phosphate phosphatase (KDO 8-P phosphatase)
VADAREEVLAKADLVTSAAGGAGAVRELCETILKVQGHWEPLMQRLF